MGRTRRLSLARRVAGFAVFWVLLLVKTAAASYHVSYEYYVYCTGTPDSPMMGEAYLEDTTYCSGDYSFSGGNQNVSSARFLADIATGQITAFADAYGHFEAPYSYWDATGRIERISFKDDITFTVPAGEYPDGVDDRRR